MNSDEINALVTKLVAIAMTAWATSAGMSGDQTQLVAGAAGTIAVTIWGVYSHWNMKKVPEGAVVVASPAPAPPKAS